MRWLRPRLTYANVIATLALFIALGGGAYAAFSLPKNSVRSENIVNGQVKPKDLAKPPRLQSAGLAKNPSFNCSNAPNQWAGSRPAVNGVVGYYRDSGGIVHLSGDAAICGTPATGATIFVLPPGYRPASFKDMTAVNNGNYGELTIDVHGHVVPPFATNGNIFALDAISFRCGPSGKHGCP